MKFVEHRVVMQEIPDEISLAFTISGCKNNCIGCHSSYLLNDIGDELTEDMLSNIIDKTKDPITNILFMGGKGEGLINIIKFLKTSYPKLKISLYTGDSDVSISLKNLLDYVKVGPYIEVHGGLTSITTNQRLYKKSQLGLFSDITNVFWK